MRSIVIIAVAFVVFFGFRAWQTDKKKDEALATARINRANAESNNIADSVSEEGFTDETIEKLNSLGEDRARALEAMGGENAKLGTFVRRWDEYQNKLAEEIDDTLLDPAIDLAATAEERNYDDRIAGVREYIAQSIEARKNTQVKPLIEAAKEVVAGLDLSSGTERDLLGTLKAKLTAQQPHLQTIHETDIALCNSVIKLQQLLKTEDGRWTWDNEEEYVEFEDDSANEQFIVFIDEIETAATQQAEAQAALLRE